MAVACFDSMLGAASCVYVTWDARRRRMDGQQKEEHVVDCYTEPKWGVAWSDSVYTALLRDQLCRAVPHFPPFHFLFCCAHIAATRLNAYDRPHGRDSFDSTKYLDHLAFRSTLSFLAHFYDFGQVLNILFVCASKKTGFHPPVPPQIVCFNAEDSRETPKKDRLKVESRYVRDWWRPSPALSIESHWPYCCWMMRLEFKPDYSPVTGYVV